VIVEDDADTRDMVSIMLESVGLDVETTKTAERARELLERREFEILVVDWACPG